jgi:hypothetical protein
MCQNKPFANSDADFLTFQRECRPFRVLDQVRGESRRV